MTTTRPSRMDVNLDSIPSELKKLPNWLVWNWTWNSKSEKWDKPPLAVSGQAGSSTDSSTWCPYDVAARSSRAFDGLGIAMGKGIGYIGVDLDDCRDPESGFLTSEAEQIIAELDTYAELSPSGTGVKLWLKGDYDKTKFRSKINNIEVYRDGRYFTVTGHRVNDRPIREIGDWFIDWMDRHLPKEQKEAGESIEATDDSQRIKHAIAACMKVEVDPGEGDGSRRLLKYARQCVRAGLTPDGCVQVVRAMEAVYPFPAKWTDAQIRKRYQDATNQSEVGEAVKHYEASDFGVARRVHDYANGSLYYIPAWGKWLAWDGRAFVPDHHGRLMQTIVAVSKQMQAESEEKAWQTFCRHYQSRKGIDSIEKLARSMFALDYKDLDKKVNLFHCDNGVVRLGADVSFENHDRFNLNTHLSKVAYIPEAKCPMWEKFISEITNGDRELAEYLQMLAGYCLTGEPCQALFILFGGGNNGKGVFTSILLEVLGDYGGPILQELLMASPNQHPTQFAFLYGKRCVIAQETNEECRLNENQVKMLTGGDPIQCRRMREDFWTFQPTHKILLATNAKPVIRGTDFGIWRRIQLIPFQVKFTNPDPELKDRLKTELPGYCNGRSEAIACYASTVP